MTTRTLSLLGAVTVALIVTAALVARQEPPGIEGRGDMLFPDLRAQLNAVRDITITAQGQTVTLTHAGTYWGVKEKAGHQAASDKVRLLLIGMSELTILEPKTRNSELYEKLGLLDVETTGSTSTQVVLRDQEGEVMAQVILGNQRPARGGQSSDEVYVRKAGDPQTWLVTGKLSVDKTQSSWIQKQILNVDIQRVHRVRVTHPGGETLTIEKDQPSGADFRVVGMPEHMKVTSQFSVNNIADTLAHLTADDVQPEAEVKAAFRKSLSAVLETFDGLRVTLRTAKKDGTYYATASAEFDQSLVQPETEATAQESEEGTEAGEEGGKQNEKETEPAPQAPPPSRLKSPEEVQQEVKAINDRRAGWAYEIPQFRAETLAKRRSDLLTKKT